MNGQRKARRLLLRSHHGIQEPVARAQAHGRQGGRGDLVIGRWLGRKKIQFLASDACDLSESANRPSRTDSPRFTNTNVRVREAVRCTHGHPADARAETGNQAPVSWP